MMDATQTLVYQVASWIALTAAIPIWLFTAVYGFGSPWYKSWLGRVLFGLMCSLSLLFIVIVVRRFAGEYPYYEWVSLVAYSLLNLMFWSFFMILLVERRSGDSLEITLRKEETVRKFSSWFTPERRQQIQAAVVTIAPLAVMFGYGRQDQWEQFLIISGAVIGALGSLLSLGNVKVTDWATEGWKIVRATIYAFGMVVAPALLALGLINEDLNEQILVGLSLGLTALSSAISIFANGQQQKVSAVETVLGIMPKSDPGTIPDSAIHHDGSVRRTSFPGRADEPPLGDDGTH
jgi:hypothetical protein